MCIDVLRGYSYPIAVEVCCHSDACPNMGFHLSPSFHSPLCFSVFYFKMLFRKHAPDGLDEMSPGVLAYRPNIQMSFHP